MTRRFRLRSRGQATVELAVLCIVLVPLIMYVLFLDDLLRYKLDAAEGVFAAPWDFTTVDYEAGPDFTNIQRQIRRGLCDHTTAYNSYDPGFECNEQQHHKGMAAHACWITKPGGQQVTCFVEEKGMGEDPFVGPFTGSVKDFNKGGKIRCTARLGVINYFLPQKVLSDFSNVDMTRTDKKKGGDIHGDAKQLGTVQSYYLLERQFMSILTDTYAMTTVKNVDRNGNSGVLYDRVNKLYPGLVFTAPAMLFGAKAVSEQMLMPTALLDSPAIGDNPMTPQVSFTTAAPPKVMDFFVSPWQDGADNKVEGSYNARGSKYFGWTQDPG